MNQERFERWLRGQDPQLPNPFLVLQRVEGLDSRLADAVAAAALVATTAANAATLVIQTAVTAATTLANNASALAAAISASLALKANIASPTLTGIPRCPTDSPGSSDTIIANTAFVQTALSAVIPPIAQTYRTLFEASGSHTAGVTPDTFSLGNGNPVVASGADSSFPSKTFSLQSADYQSISAVTPKLRIRAQLLTNATDPSCKYFFRLYPIASVAGGTGAVSIALSSPIVESEAAIVGPGPSQIFDLVGADFDLPADGVYAIGVEITHNMAANSHVVFSAQLQIHNA